MKTPYEMFGVECEDGWRGIIEPLMQECQEKGVVITQIKEKYGTLRFYVAECDAAMWNKIQKAEEASASICEKCGQPGRLRGKGWLKTLCGEHAKELNYEYEPTE